jgi:4-amino-4-deoxy-L-arabinose transferase-like glycosyltransferase
MTQILRTYRHIIILAVFVAVGLFLRWWRFDQGFIFAYDQARDAYRAASIFTQHHLMILGPETDIRGVYHGVGYYYLLGLLYWIFANPSVVGKIFALINAAGILLSYFGGLVLFQNRRTALVSALIYTVSFEVVQYARWLSNPSLGLLTVMAVYLGAWMWVRGNGKGLVLSLAGVALGMHFQFILGYLVIVPILVWVLYKPKTNPVTLLIALILFVLLMSTFIAAELKFGFPMSHAVWLFLFGHTEGAFNLMNSLVRIWNRVSGAAYFTLLPLTRTLAMLFQLIVFGGSFILYRRRRKTTPTPQVFPFLLLWYVLTLPLYVFSVGASNSEFSFMSSIPALIYICAYFFERLLSTGNTRVLAGAVLGFVVVVNVRMSFTQSDNGSSLFATHLGMTLAQERRLLDYVYAGADKKPFSVCTLTNPLFINTAWAYLFSTYGKHTYGYVPYWAGSDQASYLGGNDLTADTQKPTMRFLIAESAGLPNGAREQFFSLENFVSEVVDRKQFGSITVEKRILRPTGDIGTPVSDYQKTLSSNVFQYSCYH